MVKTTTAIALGLALLTGACGASDATSGVTIRDPGFDWWCGDVPCAWTIDEGTVRRVATWHERDYGMELVDAPVLLYQDTVLETPTCVGFAFIADVAADAGVTVELDAGADDVLDATLPVPAASWAPTGLSVPGTIPAGPLRYRIHKTGAGRAVLADVVAHLSRCF